MLEVRDLAGTSFILKGVKDARINAVDTDTLGFNDNYKCLMYRDFSI